MESACCQAACIAAVVVAWGWNCTPIFMRSGFHSALGCVQPVAEMIGIQRPRSAGGEPSASPGQRGSSVVFEREHFGGDEFKLFGDAAGPSGEVGGGKEHELRVAGIDETTDMCT